MFDKQESTEVREKILHCARDLFISKGYRGTSVRDIATASGTNVAMVNYYFHSKYALFELIFEEALDILYKRVFANITPNIPFKEMVRRWVDSYYEILLEYPQIPIFILNEITTNPEKLTERFRKRNPYIILQQLSTQITDEIARGNIREIPPIDFMLNILSLCIFPFTFRNLVAPMAEISHEQYDLLLRAHKLQVIDFIINASEIKQ